MMLEHPHPLFDTVLSFAEEKGLDGVRQDTDTMLQFEGDGTNGSWFLFISTDEREHRCSVHSMAPFFVDEARRRDVMELFTRINNDVVIGNFDLDLDNGQASFRTSIDVEGSRLSIELLSQLIAANVAAYNMYLPALEAVIEVSATPLAAFIAVRV
ncbi:MAG: hypothetical protein ACI9N0_001446 [Ilumatobacter sp.]|jgi:hypothetical protein